MLQVAVLAQAGHGPAFALWRFFGYFTILTNTALLLVTASMAWAPAHWLASPRARLMAATAIAGVGLTYSLALRGTWQPTGWQAVADHALHDAAPLLFLGLWLYADHGRLAWRDALLAMIGPALYAVYAIARGALDGWYAYWFFDPSKLAPAHMAVSVGVLLVTFAGIALVLIAVDSWLAARLDRPPVDR